MKILNLIKDWLSEHFSAAIFKERLELAKDQNTILTTKIVELESKILKLESKMSNLETEKKILEEENAKLKIEVENRKKMMEYRPVVF